MDHYRLDPRNLGFGELWRVSGLGFPLLALLKVLRIRLPDRTAIPHPVRVVRLDESELDVDGRRARMRREFDALEQDGFHLALLYKVPVLSPHSSVFAASFLSDDTWVYGVIIETVVRVGPKVRREKRLSLVTPLADGRFLATGSRPAIDSPPEFESEVVRRGGERLVRRHRERMREATCSPRSIDAEELESFIAGLERRAAEFQIARKAWVRVPDREVEKLRGLKPGGGTWHLGSKVVGWISAIALSLVWTLGGVHSCALLPGDEGDVSDLWSTQTRITHSCTTPEPAGAGSPDTRPQVATIAAVFDSASRAGAMEAPARSAIAAGPDSPDGELRRLGNTLFYRTTSGEVEDARPVYEAWLGKADAVAVLGEKTDGRSLSFTAVWTLSGDEDEDRATSIEAYLDAAFFFQLRPPWARDDAGQPAVSPVETNARRTIHRLQQAEREELTAEMFGPFATVKALWLALTTSAEDENWREQYAAHHEERINDLRALAGRLAQEDPTLDAEVLELYVAQQDEIGRLAIKEASPSNPFEEAEKEDLLPHQTESARRLQAHLGAVPRAEGAEAESALDDLEAQLLAGTGWVRRSDADFGMTLFLTDPAVSSRAILDFVCGGEVSEVTFGFSEGGL